MTETVIGSERPYVGRMLSLRVDTVRKPSGRVTTREIVEHRDSVVIAALDDDGRVLLVRQFRSALGRELIELPAGKTESGEIPEESARRELEEETGYRAATLEAMGGFYAGPGYSTEYLHLFCARDLAPTGAAPDGDEIAQVLWVPLAEAQRMIVRGEICDAKSVAGLLRVMVEGKA